MTREFHTALADPSEGRRDAEGVGRHPFVHPMLAHPTPVDVVVSEGDIVGDLLVIAVFGGPSGVRKPFVL